MVASKPSRIHSFTGDYRFLSNFYRSVVMHDGIVYSTVEHAFQAAKTLDFKERWSISELGEPGSAKRAGRKVDLRPDWEASKGRVMTELVFHKFTFYRDLRRKLLATGEALLIEGNTWHDNYWGDCTCVKCQDTPGENVLGQILMDARETLRDLS